MIRIIDILTCFLCRRLRQTATKPYWLNLYVRIDTLQPFGGIIHVSKELSDKEKTCYKPPGYVFLKQIRFEVDISKGTEK